MFADSLVSMFMCFSSLNVFGFILYMVDSKSDINSSIDLQWRFLISVLAVAVLCLCSVSLSMISVWRCLLIALFFSVLQLILFRHPTFFIFFIFFWCKCFLFPHTFVCCLFDYALDIPAFQNNIAAFLMFL